MDDGLLTSEEAARRLGVSKTTFYDWLAQSNAGSLQIRGLAFAWAANPPTMFVHQWYLPLGSR